MPVTRDIAEIPPAPHALLSAAANNRRDLSSRTPSRAWKRLRTPAKSPILVQYSKTLFEMSFLNDSYVSRVRDPFRSLSILPKKTSFPTKEHGHIIRHLQPNI